MAVVICAAAACSIVSGVLLAFVRPDASAKVSQRTLTFAERVAYQRAIEDVYWRHRIWPKERPDPKPSLDGVMPQAQLEKKVTEYLRKSQTLEDYWQRPITADQLQAEMERIASHTKQPGVLREIFGALGNDAFVIAECLARPVLAERLLTELNNDDRAKLTRIAWRKQPLHSWVAEAETQMPVTMAAVSANYKLPVIASPSGSCTDDTWTPTNVISAPAARQLHAAVWTGSEMIVWGGAAGFSNYLNTGGRYNPGTDSWTAASTINAPGGRYGHTAVWTGSEMIVWGGWNGSSYLNTGGRYNPGTDSWTATSTTNAPLGRFLHTAVWTGSEMVVWGGTSGSDLNTGGRYNPGTDSWTATSTTNAPLGREHHTAIWTGSEMIVWGGLGQFVYLNSGGRYDPGTDSWAATSTTSAPSARIGHTTVWTGSEMIVWGGFTSGPIYFNTGGRYNPTTDSWTATSTTNAPSARELHTTVWTGSKMIVWGGHNVSGYLNTGGRYNPSTDSWTTTSTTNAPAARHFHTAVWTATEMIVWGGYNGINVFNTGGRYCAAAPNPTPTPTPTPTATPCAPVGAWTEQSPYPISVVGHAVVSQGGNVYSFGGIANNVAIANAYKYTPATNTWMPIASLPEPRRSFSGASDGIYIYLLGGVDQNSMITATLWRYDPVSNTYDTNLPSYTIPTYWHASAYLNGKIYRIAGRNIMSTDSHVEVYNIATNSWSMAANYPFANHNLMGVALGNYIYAGGGNASPSKTWRYDPSTDTWDDAAIADLPAGRFAAASGAYNGRWLLAGGYVNFVISNSAIAWDPATNTWNNLSNMVQARESLAGATAGQSFYAVAGSSGPGPTSDNQQYTETGCATPTPTPTPTTTPTATATATFTPTPTPTATHTPTPTATASFTPTPTATATATATATFTPTPTATLTPTATATPTATPTSTPRPSPTPRFAPTPRPRPTPPPRP